MALATLVLPSSGGSTATKAGTGDQRTDSRRHDHHHHHGSKRKKKPPPPSPQPSLPSAPRTPPGARSHRVVMAASSSSSRKSPMVPAAAAAKNNNHAAHYQQRRGHHQPTKKAAAASSSSSSWEQVKSLLSCRSATAAARVHDPSAPSALARLRGASGAGTCGASLCPMRDVVDAASSAASASDTAPLNRRRAHRGAGSSSSAASGSGNSRHHSSLRARGLSGCYECRAINVEPMSRRYPRARELCACPQCGEVFTKADTMEQHQAIRHAVSELGPEDSGRNIVGIIFKSSWQKRDRRSICHIDRILKVHNAPRTVASFEAYRDAVRSRCRAVVAARAAADGNELLRFHSAPLACALGLSGATALCCAAGGGADDATTSSPCGVCTAIRHGFAPWVGAHPLGVRTTASSGRAHDCGSSASSSLQPHQPASDTAACRAMLVCRVIAGRVRRDGDGATSSAAEEDGPFDSVAGEDASSSSVYGNLEELFVANPRAILPCFVVIYRVLDS
ncbi:unnamed protein product [Miscanthus lutarioriparius]|uniref:C2H2-type domain-containing protein n=1 Tax=Miscanthus lutarioriparius TaxID=422564 RepID=A0A811QYJ9_9POAL|nr:unnamed protein product [Miscanthus lutarioriparius]